MRDEAGLSREDSPCKRRQFFVDLNPKEAALQTLFEYKTTLATNGPFTYLRGSHS